MVRPRAFGPGELVALSSIFMNLSGVLSASISAGTVTQFAKLLGAALSSGASIYLPGSEEFINTTQRWSEFEAPRFAVAVEVATAKDVQETVKYSNLFKLPFLATGGTHGSIQSLGALDYGVDIYMRKLNSIQIEKNGHTAIIGGGVISKNLTDTLWKQGKQTVTGTCECLSLLGPTLGGGQGWLEGRYGLALDNIVEAQVVIADGTLITASKDSHPDLNSSLMIIQFWGLRGAGHNFGIVTSVKYKVYDVPENNIWTVGTYFYTEDQFDSVFELINKFTAGGEQPVGLLIWTNFFQFPDIDPNNAVIQVEVIFEGNEQEALLYTRNFTDLGPAASTVVVADFTELSGLTEQGIDQFPCQKLGNRGPRFVVNAREYNVTAHRAAFDVFNAATRIPGMENSLFLADGYAAKGVMDVPADSTAYPDRPNILHLSAVFIYSDPALDEVAITAGREIRRILIEGLGSTPFNAYVNYAFGDETVEQLYGHEKWRIDKLRALKAKYDPLNRFNYYAPIVR